MRMPLRGQCVHCERPRCMALLVLVSLSALSTAHAALVPAWTLEPGGIMGPRSSRIIPSSVRDGGSIAWAPVPTVMAGVGRGASMCELRQPGWALGRMGMKLRSVHLQVCSPFRLHDFPALGTIGQLSWDWVILRSLSALASSLDGHLSWTGSPSPSQPETLECPTENLSSCWKRND